MKASSNHCLAALALAFAATTCNAASVEVMPPETLAAATPLAVSGRVGWRPGRELRFGDYVTQDLKSSAQSRTIYCPNDCSRFELGIYRSHFEESFSTSAQRTRFTLAGPEGAIAHVQLTDQLDEQRRDWATRWFGLPTDYGRDHVRQISVIGTVQPADASLPGWRFALRDDGRLMLTGWAEDDTGRQLVLSPLQQLKGRNGAPVSLPGMALGYAFELDGRPVAAVATQGAGTVWFSPDLAPELRPSLAGLASALLIRPSFGR